jgi:acetyltransferase
VNVTRDAGWRKQACTFRTPRGERITVRPTERQDASLLQAYMRGLSTETRHNRFLAAVGELSPARLEQVVSKDRPGEVALLAFADAEEMQVIAEAALVKTPEGHRCEIAVSVADAWQGKGVGTLLLRHLECKARTLYARFLFGDVLRTNAAMKSLARKEGFSILTPLTDPRLIEVGKDL